MEVALLCHIVEEKTNMFLFATVRMTFLFCLVRFNVHSPSRNPLFSQLCSFCLSDHLLPCFCLQNEGLSLNMCPEPFHTRGEGAVATCLLLNPVQCKTVSTSVQMLSCSRDRVDGKRSNIVPSLKCNQTC